jgi:hypothetical protein
MKHQSHLTWLIPLIALLALVCILAGLWPAEGAPYPLINFRGEAVTINARGLYYYDTVSSAAQMQANDFIALVVGLPLLAISTFLAFRGSLRGRLLLSGTLGFFLYTYMSMSFNTAFNNLFLAYVVLFALSLLAFILSLMAFDLDSLPAAFSPRLPRGWIAGLLFIIAGFLTLAWVGGRIAPTWRGAIPLMENTTTMVIQALDLALVTPLCFLGALLLLRRSPWGYLLSAIAVMKGLTMGLAVSAMGINAALQGEPDSAIIVGMFVLITLANLVMAVVLLRHVSDRPAARAHARHAAHPAPAQG